MKWFKHISDSLDDPFIFSLLDEFGDFGYLAFFGILEIYAREFKPEKDWKLVASLSFFRSKLHQSSVKRVKNFLQSEKLSKKWDVNIEDNMVTIFVPKFIEIIDEWTQRKISQEEKKLGSKSGESPKILNPDKEAEVEAEVDINTNSIYISPQVSNFVIEFIDFIIQTKPKIAPKKTPTLIKNSEDAIDKLIRIDGFEFEYIRDVLKFAVLDDFWSKNLLSLSPLRKKSKNNDLTKFQNMAASYENKDKRKPFSISDQNKKACADAIKEMEEENGKQ